MKVLFIYKSTCMPARISVRSTACLYILTYVRPSTYPSDPPSAYLHTRTHVYTYTFSYFFVFLVSSFLYIICICIVSISVGVYTYTHMCVSYIYLYFIQKIQVKIREFFNAILKSIYFILFFNVPY